MHDQHDKLTPGGRAKFAFFVDLLIIGGTLGALAMFGQVTDQILPLVGLIALALASWTFMSVVMRLYSPFTQRQAADAVILAVLATTVTALVIGIVDLFFFEGRTLNISVYAPATGIGHTLVQMVLVWLANRNPEITDRVLIVGTDSLGGTTAKLIEKKRKVIGFLRFEDDPSAPRNHDAPVLGNAEDLGKVLEEQDVDEVYLAGRVVNRGFEMQKLVKILEEVGQPFAVPLHSLRFNRAQLLSTSKARDGYLHYLNTPSRPVAWAVKRLVDISCSLAALVALSPLLAIVALIIKTDGGPALYRQTRVGLHGAHFSFLKFRSMVMNADKLKDKLLEQNERGDGPAFKMKNDPRVTRVGRFIRKFSIDELPQLVNILRGDMTIVGPRPPVPREVAEYKAWQRRRLSVRPGLTCYWQVGGRDEISFDEWMLLDLRYVDNWTIGKDIRLILMTIPAVVTGRGAS